MHNLPSMPGYEDNVYVSNAANLAKYMKLDQKGKVLAEYIWIDGHNGLRNKTKVSTLFSSPPCHLYHQSTVVPNPLTNLDAMASGIYNSNAQHFSKSQVVR